MVALAATSCDEDDATAFRLYGFNPNPAVRGEALTFYGEGLSTVNLVRFVGGAEVTDITRSGNTISVIIPMTAQPGAIELCYPGGSYVTVSALQLDEPLASDADFNGYTDYESKTNGTTVVGSKFYIETALETDYLSDIVKVEFAGDEAVVEFDEDAFAAALGEEPLTEEKLFELSETLDFVRSQHLVIVTIPETAKSGVVSIYNSNDDRFTGPEVTIAQSMAESVAPMTNIIPGYTELTIKGENFDLVVSATFAGDKVVELGNGLNVSADGKTITLQTVLGMQDGAITLHTKSGDTIATEAIETIVPQEFAVSAADNIYKNGKDFTLKCTDSENEAESYAILSQISNIYVGGVEAAITADEASQSLVVNIPATAPFESVVTLLTHAGKEGNVADIVLVEPAFTTIPAAVDGGESFVVEGTDLDLISKVTLGGTECEFTANGEATQLEVKTERSFQSGALVAVSTNGTEYTLAEELVVNYVGEVMITSMPAKAAPGDEITLEGQGFNKVESVYLGATKVVAYTERSDARLSFIVPAETEGGDYNITFNLTTGVVETSPQMITISGMKIVEQTLWEGSVDLAGWSGNLQLPADLFADCTTETQFTLHYENQGGGQFKIQDGTWTNLEMVDKSPYWEGVDAAEGSTSYTFSLNAEQLAAVQSTGMVIAGQNLILTKLTILVAVPDTGGPEPVLDTDIMLNDYEPHGDHNSGWDDSWADGGAATEFLTEDGNTYIRVCAPLTGWFVNCNHQIESGGAFGAVIDDISKYNLKFDLKIEDGVVGCSAVQMQVVLADGWFWYGENFFPETTEGEWITVTLSLDGIVSGAVDTTSGTNGLASNTAIPAGLCLDNLRLSLK